MSAIINKLKGQTTGKSGLNQGSNTVRMTATVTAPFLIGWLLLRIFVPEEYADMATVVMFAVWMAYVLVLYSKTKADSASYLPFPQSHWFFPDGQQINYDLFVPPEPYGYKLLKEYPDGSRLYRTYFKDRYEYQDSDRPFPDVFDFALWKIPAAWTDAFARKGHGEFFFENLFVDHPACENIEVSVVGWMEQGSTRIPIGVVTGCSWFYKQAVKGDGDETKEKRKNMAMSPSDVTEANIADLTSEVLELRNRNNYLEREHEQFVREEPSNVKKLSDDRMKRAREKVGNIMDTKGSLLSRILNLKTFGFLIAITICVLLLTHFLFGYP